ncbi:MAG TPA: GTPase ObgE, partial [Clostridia bacterium]|nr:GTPase ObgE [Clostridia bacterium]
HDLNNLIAQYYQPRLIAQDGQGGLGKGMDGHAGKDLVIKVPCGTLVWRVASQGENAEGEQDQPGGKVGALPASISHRPLFRTAASFQAVEVDLSAESTEPETNPGSRPKGELVADLTQHGQRFILCKGGRGGLGNRNFATATRQAPRFAQPGEPGEEGEFLFELRIIAEVGLVGYPNAGKSTLLTAISHARPKIAPYPFTTLHPQIGIVEYSDFRRLTVCDVPGLIEGAHRNVGLGHEFLRHIQRCKVLVVLLDMAGTDGRAPWDDYKKLLQELELYDSDLLARPRLVVANKMDEPQAEANLKSFKRRIPKTPVMPIAAAFDEGVEKFKKTIRDEVEEVEKAAADGE